MNFIYFQSKSHEGNFMAVLLEIKYEIDGKTYPSRTIVVIQNME